MICHRCFHKFGTDPEDKFGVRMTDFEKIVVRELQMGGWVTMDHIINVVYGQKPPDSCTNLVNVYVTRLRNKGLSIDGRRDFGYRLACDPEPRHCPKCGWEARPEFPSPDCTFGKNFTSKELDLVQRMAKRIVPLSSFGSTDNAAAVWAHKIRKKMNPDWELRRVTSTGYQIVRA